MQQHLGEMTTVELSNEQNEDKPILIVPLGATEQHGPHLPLNTDTTLAIAWAEAVTRLVPGSIIAPAIPYGSSGEHQMFSGTLSIGQEALRLVIVELVRSARHTFARVVLLSGHGGNFEPLDAAVAQLKAEGHDVVHFFPAWPPLTSDDGTAIPIDAHAGFTETSLMLHLRTDAVRLDLLAAGTTAPVSELMAEMSRHGVAAVSSSGVLGDPTEADADVGKRLLSSLAKRTAKRIEAASSGAPAD